jgi:hypothetical protein
MEYDTGHRAEVKNNIQISAVILGNTDGKKIMDDCL